MLHEIHDGAHSILGASSSERWINCPGSVLATKDLPDEQTEYAAEGTAAHTLSEWCRLRNVKAETFRGHKLKVGKFEFEVDQEMIDGVQDFVDRVNAYPGVPLVEHRVSYERWVPGGFGTLDHGSLARPTTRIDDLKFGKGVAVDAKENPQLMLYAVGVAHDFSPHVVSPDNFVLTVHQPRRDYVGEWEVSAHTVIDWVESVARPAALLALTPGAPFKAGPWCQFCKIRATCKTRARAVFEEAVGEFEDLDATLNSHTLSQAGQMTNEQLAKAWRAISGIRAWCKHIESHVAAELLANRAVGAIKFVAGRGSRSWNKPEAEIRAALEAEMVDPYERKLISPPQAEKRLGKKHPIMVELVAKSDGKPTLAAGDDPRPALKVGADVQLEFDDLDA